jgi:hypothetical protein
MKSWLLFIVFFIPCFVVDAATYVTLNSGEWADSGTWLEGLVPPIPINSNDSIIINTSHEVNLTGDFAVNSTSKMVVNGSLLIEGDVILNNSVSFYIRGNLMVDGTFTINNTSDVRIEGDCLTTQDVEMNQTSSMINFGSFTTYGNFIGTNLNSVSGQGEINAQGIITGINVTSFLGELNQYTSAKVGLTNYGCYIKTGSDDVIYIDGGSQGNFNVNFNNTKNGKLTLDGTIIIEGDLNNYSADSAFNGIDGVGNIVFKGTSTQKIGGSKSINLESLTIDNPNGLLIDEDVTIHGILDFNSGSVSTNDFDTLIIKNTNVNAINNQGDIRTVIGNLRRYLAFGTYNYPLSSGGDYLPAVIDITGLGSMKYVSAKFTSTSSETVPSGLNVEGTPIVEFLDRGYWTFTPDNGTGVTYDITLTSSGHTNGGAESGQHAIFKRDGGDWENVGLHNNATQSGSGTDAITVKRSGLTGFSDFIIGLSEAWPLPVVLSTFRTNCVDKGIEITWETLSEEGNQLFILEYSFDGKTFKTLFETPGAGNSNSNISYSYYHPIIVASPIYYKLVQLDFDGDTYEYPVIPAYCIRELFEDVIVTKSNSTQVEFSYTSKSNESFQMSLVDQLGRKIMNQPMNAIVGFNRHTVGIHNCAPGVYLLNLVSLNQQYSKKIILN